MALQKLNLTELKINKELDVLALLYPSQTYKILLNNPEFRKNLLGYIMQSIPTQYLLIESQEEFYELRKTIKCTTSEKTMIYNLTFQRFNELRTRKKPDKSSPINVNNNGSSVPFMQKLNIETM
jgi:hypothetical protein